MANAPKLEVIIGANAEALKAALADLKQSLNAVSSQAKDAGAQTAFSFSGAESQFGKTRAGLVSISEQLSIARRELIGFFSLRYGAALAKDLIDTADAVTNMNARLKLATRTNEEYTTAQKALFDISKRTATALESNITLYARIAESMRQLGRAQSDTLSFTEAIDQSMRISGASIEESKSSITQLSQALASGILRGDEFNSMMENAPRLSRALADGLNVPIGQLRAMAEAGQLTADKVIGALLSQKDKLAEEYASIPLTVGAAFTQLTNAFTQYIGDTNQADGATKTLADAIAHISQNFKEYADTVISVGKDALVIWAAFGAVKMGAAVLELRASTAAVLERAAADTAALNAARTLAAEEKVAATAAVNAAKAHHMVAAAALAEAEGTLAAARAAAVYGPAMAAAEREVAAARSLAAKASMELTAAQTANAAALSRSAAAAGLAAPAIGKLSLATGLLTRAMGPLLTAFLVFEALQVAGKWLGEFTAKLVVGDQEVKKFASGTKLGMEVAEAATRSMAKETAKLVENIQHGNDLNTFNQVGESAEAAQKKIKDDTDALLKSFDAIVAKSGDVGKALEKMWESADHKTPAGITALFAALDQLKEQGKATGEQIQNELQKGLEKLDVTQLRSFQMGLQLADVSAQNLTDTLDTVVDAALKKMGTDALTISSGLSKAFHDTEQIFQLLSDNAQATGEQIKFAFDKLLDSAKTTKEAEALKAEFEQLKETGKLSAAEIKDEYARLQAKLNELAGQIDGALGDAFKRMGIKSAEAMRASFAQMVDDFDKIKASGQASAEGIAAAYEKSRSTIAASVQAITQASREALAAAKDHTAAVQATTAAIEAQAAANTASANAQKADAEYARASDEAMKSSSESALAKAEALGVAAQAAHAAADAAQADAEASKAAAVAAQAEEAAKLAMAAAAANPSEATKAAAAAAQDYANRMAQGAESTKQTAAEAHAVASGMASAASEASAMAAGVVDAGKAMSEMSHYLSNAAIDQSHFAAVAENANAAWKDASNAVQNYIRQAQHAGQQTGAISEQVAAIMRGAAGTGHLATEAMQTLQQSLQRTADGIKRNEQATRAWQSAMDSLRGAAASLKDELDRALGNDKAIEDRAYQTKKQQLESQLKAAQEAAAIGKDSKAAGEAQSAYQSALADLDQLHNINLKNIADAAAAKSAANGKNHAAEMASIAAEQAARGAEVKAIADQAIQTARYGGGNALSGAAASDVASSVATNNSYGGNTVHNTLNVMVDGTDLLSEEQIRRKIAPTITKMMNGSR